MRCTTGSMRKWLRKLDITHEDYYEWWSGTERGGQNLRLFAKLNPDWPLRAFVGLMLEYLEEKSWKQKLKEEVVQEVMVRKRGRPPKPK